MRVTLFLDIALGAACDGRLRGRDYPRLVVSYCNARGKCATLLGSDRLAVVAILLRALWWAGRETSREQCQKRGYVLRVYGSARLLVHPRGTVGMDADLLLVGVDGRSIIVLAGGAVGNVGSGREAACCVVVLAVDSN